MTAVLARPTAHPEMHPPDRNRRAQALAGFRQRSKRVHFWRKALPATMAAIVIGILGWIGVRAALSALTDPSRGTIHLTNFRFYSQDDNGRSFRIESKEAVRDGRQPDRITLAAPGLMLDAGGGRSVRGSAGAGLYDQSTRLLDLSGKVDLADGRGYRFRSDTAQIDLKKGLITGNSSVVGEGPLGRIAASSYAVYDEGARVVFSGKVHAELVSK